MLRDRIKLAKEILSHEWIIFISIDDNEYPRLKEILEEIYEQDYTDIFVWRRSGFGRYGKMKNVTTFRKDHEYVAVAFKEVLNMNKALFL